MARFDKYYGLLRRIKPLYSIYNLTQIKRLRYLKPIYKKLGISKPVFASISSKDFENAIVEFPWLDSPSGMEELRASQFYRESTKEMQDHLTNWVENGFMLLRNYFTPQEVAEINAEVDKLRGSGKVDFNYTGKKIMSAYKESDLLETKVAKRSEIVELLSFLFGKPAHAFQSINFEKSSEQRAHSDSVHMATHPKGFLCATWLALENIGPTQGPLQYYPGSHRWPYLGNKDFGAKNSGILLDEDAYLYYENKVQEVIATRKAKPETLHPNAGDLFIWHANLVHGAHEMTDKNSTRKSMVVHYFAEGVACYHEITQRPALIDV